MPWGRGGTRHTSPSALCLLQALSTTQPLLCSGPNATQLEDAASGANGLPRRQAPVPSLETPPQLSICAGPSEGGDGKSRVPGAPGQACLYCSCPACPGAAPGLWGRDRGAGGSVPSSHCPLTSPGTFSVSDEERPSEESYSTMGLCQASGPPMLVQKKAWGAGDRALGAAGGPWGLSILPHPHGQPSKQHRVGTLMTRPGPDTGAHGPQAGAHPMR